MDPDYQATRYGFPDADAWLAEVAGELAWGVINPDRLAEYDTIFPPPVVEAVSADAYRLAGAWQHNDTDTLWDLDALVDDDHLTAAATRMILSVWFGVEAASR